MLAKEYKSGDMYCPSKRLRSVDLFGLLMFVLLLFDFCFVQKLMFIIPTEGHFCQSYTDVIHVCLLYNVCLVSVKVINKGLLSRCIKLYSNQKPTIILPFPAINRPLVMLLLPALA